MDELAIDLETDDIAVSSTPVPSSKTLTTLSESKQDVAAKIARVREKHVLKKQPKEYQLEGVRRMLFARRKRNHGMMLADEMGLGKVRTLFFPCDKLNELS